MEEKYCAFIDVLGYGNIVMDETLTPEEKLRILNSIYVNLATQFSNNINFINRYYGSDIYIRSFSDCFYLDCNQLEPLLVAIKDIFSNTFGFYTKFTEREERTPLLRCGVVKGWLAKFRDIGAITSGGNELNPVGYAVAKAYYTAEKSNLSGMRIIISPEVFNDLNALQSTFPEFDCYVKDLHPYGVPFRYYFRHIAVNEKQGDNATNLYEMLWPHSRVDDNPRDCIDILNKIRASFQGDATRHFTKTAKLFRDSFLLSSWRNRDEDIFNRNYTQLQTICNQQG